MESPPGADGAHFTFLQVGVDALRQPRPRSADGTEPSSSTVAPLNAALLVAARRVLPRLRLGPCQKMRCSRADGCRTLVCALLFLRAVQLGDPGFGAAFHVADLFPDLLALAVEDDNGGEAVGAVFLLQRGVGFLER